jgi:class 3 adenylate cyclase/tetratricopeptide (TPR) repeat protein
LRRSIRRFVTVVRSDVQGSTGLGERHDPELVRRVLRRYYDTTRTVCTHHGGIIEQIQGDAVVAIFDGHEDDALRAVRAAAGLRGAMARLNEELERDAGIRLPIRMAVDSGDVVAGAGGPGELTGDVMNVVAHLEREARPGEILVGEATVRLVRDAVVVEETGPFALKGKEEPVRAYRLLVLLPGVTGRAHLSVPMVGREPERALLEAAYERAATERTCHLVTVLGAAGVGKSRLAEELVTWVRQRARVLRGCCPDYGGRAYDALIQVVIEAAGIDLADRDTALRRLGKLVAGVDGAVRITERVAQVLGFRRGAGPPEDTHWALRRLLEIVARERPLIVVLDDLHRADPALLDLVEDIAECSRDAPLLLVCAARLELLDARRNWAGGKVNAVTIQLQPLDADKAKQLVSYVLGGVATAPGVEEYIVDRSGGNPLFVQGLVAMLRDEQLLRVDEGRWRAVVDELEAPRDIQAVLSARLDRLGAAERGVVERAAVIGRQFTKEAIIQLSPVAERAWVTASLLTLIRKELIVPDPDSVVGHDERFAFAHALIQEVAYHSIGKQARAELHERFADWLLRRGGGDRTQVDEVVGHHLLAAHRNLVAVGRNDERTANLARRAGEALAAAGHRATARRDIPGPAVSLLRDALSLLKRNDEVRRAALLDLGDALADSQRPLEALEIYGKAIEEAEAAGDRRRATHGKLGVLAVKGFLGRGDEAMRGEAEVVRSALGLFCEIADNLGLTKAWRAKAYLYWTAGRLKRAEAACRRAIDFAQRAGDEQLEAGAVSSRCFILFWGPTPVDEVTRYVRQALEWARSRGIRRLSVDALRILARIAAMKGRFSEARTLLDEASEAEVPGELLVLVGGYLSNGIVGLMAGEPAAAEQVLRQGHQVVARLGGTGQLVSVDILLARALAMQGRDDEAMERTLECERSALEGQRDAQIKWRAIRAVLLARRGELDEAERLAAEAVALTAGSDQDDSTAEVLADQAHVLRLAGKEERAQRQAQRALELYRRKGNLVGAARVQAFLQTDRP